MSEDNDKKRPDLTDTSGVSGRARSSGEDPLIELARIVHNNKQTGAPVNSGRVGSTDYFADLDDFARDPQPAASAKPVRQEPVFSDELAPSQQSEKLHGGFENLQTGAQYASHGGQSAPAANDYPEPAFEQPREDTQVVAGWPEVPELETIESTAARAMNRAAPVAPQPAPEPRPSYMAETGFGGPSNSSLAASVSTDLEQNLTAELEDELKGALRHTIDQTGGAAAGHEDVTQATAASAPQTTGNYYSSSLQAPGSGYTQTFGEEPQAEFRSASGQTGAQSHTREAVSSRFDEPVQLKSTDFAQPEPVAPRPAINEDDLFAALTAEHDSGAETQPVENGENSNAPIAGIDTLLADLDFPERETRPQPAAKEPAPASVSTAASSDLDDMVWPAAADAVPDVAEEDTPPPPEGYDLDAVARAMQESDPTLKGSGVLPPHSAAEQAAVPHAEEQSRRGLFVAGGVLAVAALGAAGFFFLDSGGIEVPDGPPPVISGLQEPLKVFPEAQDQATGDNQSAKLIYDRVDGTSENIPAHLTPNQTPEPASLPPAPAGVQSGADLVPGATKRVRTVIVRPDGTIVSGEDAAPAPALSEPSEPRTVTTQPVTTAPDAAPSESAAAQTAPQPASPTPAAPETPEIVASPEPAVPAGPAPEVLPRKKPAAPVRVAQAPAAAANPAPANTNGGPLDLAQPATTPAATVPATGGVATGTIPSGTYIVQVTSQRSAAAASDAYSGLQRRYPSILGNRNAVIVAADLGDRGTFYRARIPTGSRGEADNLCGQLQSAGGDCFVRRMP